MTRHLRIGQLRLNSIVKVPTKVYSHHARKVEYGIVFYNLQFKVKFPIGQAIMEFRYFNLDQLQAI
jgi:hypothetical protein